MTEPVKPSLDEAMQPGAIPPHTQRIIEVFIRSQAETNAQMAQAICGMNERFDKLPETISCAVCDAGLRLIAGLHENKDLVLAVKTLAKNPEVIAPAVEALEALQKGREAMSIGTRVQKTVATFRENLFFAAVGIVLFATSGAPAFIKDALMRLLGSPPPK
ncbi:MAG: hypothetical protein ACKO0Z_07830 [Betaproteobacteria bacterium]